MLCRLCLVESTSKLLGIFDAEGIQLKIVEIISKYLWFSPAKDDPISNKICCSCWTKLSDFHTFYCFVKDAQKNLVNITQCTTTDSDTSTLLPITLDSLKQEDVFQDKFENVQDNDWQSENLPVTIFPEVLINKGNSPLSSYESSNDIKMEDNLFVPDTVNNLNKVNSKKRKSGRKPRKKLKKICITEITKKVTSRSKKFDSDKSEIGLNNENNINSMVPLTKTKEKTQNSNKISIGQQKQVIQNKLDELEKLAQEKKIKEEDELIAKFVKLFCDRCDQEFNTFFELTSHFRREHKKKNGYAICCNRKIYAKYLLIDHINCHINPEAFKCIPCNKNFKDSHNLKVHLDHYHTSDESKLLKCNNCDKTFANKKVLDKHNLTHIPPEERPFQCDICKNTFATEARLNDHIKQVHEKRFHLICDICGKKYACKALLEKHRLEHEGIIEKIQCQKCGVWLKGKRSAKSHMRRHEEESLEFKCELCGKSAPSKNALRDHISYNHKMERKYKCTICDKAFKEEITLKEHMMTHTGGALYTCTFCTRTFNSKANMYSHRKKAHPIEWEEETRRRMMLASDSIKTCPNSSSVQIC